MTNHPDRMVTESKDGLGEPARWRHSAPTKRFGF